jgi:hypothetical protein
MGRAKKIAREKYTAQARHQLMAILKTHASISDETIQMLKDSVVASDYFAIHNLPCNIVDPKQKYYRDDGSEHTFEQVPLETIAETVKCFVYCKVPKDCATEILDMVLTVVPPTPEPSGPSGPNLEPRTPYSESKAVCIYVCFHPFVFFPFLFFFFFSFLSRRTWVALLTQPQRSKQWKSNDKLIEDLASAADMSPSSAIAVRQQIIWKDAACFSQFPCMIVIGTWKISGGRLGRDPRIDDVPNCYFRDCIMDYISTQLPEHTRQSVRSAVFSDLSGSELESYSELIAEYIRELDEDHSRDEYKRKAREKPRQQYPLEAFDQMRRLTDIATCIARQETSMRNIDETIDLTPGIVMGHRNFSRAGPIRRSVIKPGSKALPEESSVEVEGPINYECDQVRAMIKRFVQGGDWTLDQFRLSLNGRVTRTELASFMQKRGPYDGRRYTGQISVTFELCWEFFYRREKLGLPLVGASPQRDMDLVSQPAPNRDNKRSAAAVSRDAKRAKTAARILG